ncbi:MAG: hypothetical protein KHZ15_07905 [Coprobacillus cateniformis]|uniref:Uncharacterized protein n=1 Tax=Longibaculum muris TaxID=1796628 RepID=A0A4R3YPS0_9FIRM|nr:hypothetical protein [Longibaculum muris]MBS5112596.1 hypothetical protein [Coprobacillus cateniformis]MBS5370286.1 hypothetical protein [Coprobacillus cateniformis]MCR1889034.1 hypothetical protein [Longibaculum muris]MED9811172.1 hypothetical protein [Longibaculum muris]TCV93588.1 hypothetical protein EDD60_12322 [Longibaculum muris]
MKLLLKCLFILAFVVLVVLGVQYADEYSKDEDLKRVNDTILQLSLKCYSIEGKYPQDIEYLKKNYGLLVNEDDYHILYHFEGDNLKPTIRVYEKENDYE